MRRVTTVICVLIGLLLTGCDFYTGRAIRLDPEGSYLSEEGGVALEDDFARAAKVLARFALSEGFEGVVDEWQPLRRVYQKNANDRVFWLTITHFDQSDAITIAVLEAQTRRRSDELDRIYAALCNRFEAEFQGRIIVEREDQGLPGD